MHHIYSTLPVFLVVAGATVVQGRTGQCGESRCRGTRIHPWVDNDRELTCWIPWSQMDNVTHPSYCADGYVGHIVHDVPPEEVDGEMAAWYTCCEPDFEGVAQQTCTYSTCSSPDWAKGSNCWADGFQEPMSCGDRTYRYPHLTSQKSLIYFQFMCCDTPQSNTATRGILASRILWMLFSSITVITCTVFIAAILKDNNTRSESWNMYLVFLAVPDAFVNVIVILRNSLTIPGVPVSPSLHIFFASVEYFYSATNLWLNGVIIGQIYFVLCNSNPHNKVPPPSIGLVIKQSIAVYFFGIVSFIWAFYMYFRGLVDYTLDTVVNIWISTRGLLLGPPLVFMLWICFDVWHRNLLPRSGRTRVLSLYFLRVIVVFLFTWIPYFIMFEIAWNMTYSTWMVNFSYYLASIQGTISILVALGKPDVEAAIRKLLFGTKNKSSSDNPSMAATHELPRGGPSDDDIDRDNDWYKDDVWGSEVDLDVILAKEDEAKPEQAVPVVKKKTEGMAHGTTFDLDDADSIEDQTPAPVKCAQRDPEWFNKFVTRFALEREQKIQRVLAEREAEEEREEKIQLALAARDAVQTKRGPEEAKQEAGEAKENEGLCFQ